MEAKKAHTPLPWQKSQYVHRKEYETNGPEWRAEMERNEDTIVRGPGVVGTPVCNVIGRFNTKEDRDFCVETLTSHSALVAACETLIAAAKKEFDSYTGLWYYDVNKVDMDEFIKTVRSAALTPAAREGEVGDA